MNKKFLELSLLALVLILSGFALAPSPVLAASSGPNSPGTGSNDVSIGTQAWATPTNVVSSNDSSASALLMNSEISNYLKASNFGFSIPTGAVINGIQVSIERRRVTGAGIIIQDNVIEIVSGASTSSDNKASINAWPTSDGVASYGSASDTWGNSWTPAQINDPTFGVLIAVQRTDVTGGNHSAYVDYISVTVTYTIIPTSILTITPAVGTYGATTSLTSTLSPALAGKTISFSLNGSLIGSTTTDSGGVATLSNASLIGINVGDYPAGISASFAGDGDGLASSDTASLTVDKRDITVTAVADSKIYDGEVISVKIPTITSGNLVGTDSVTWAQTFDDKNVGTSKILTPAGVVSDGNGGDNYTVTFLPDPTGVITVKDLTVSATGVNKIYDSFSTASVTLSDDRVANDILTDNYASASFADKNVGVGKTVSVTGISISGADAGNYNLLNTTASPTADITAKDLVVTATGINKVFDENTNAEVTLANNALVGDIITSSYTSASFDDATSSANKPVHVIGIVVAGTDAGNYTLISPTAETTASITPNGATISLNKASLSRPYTGSPQEITVDSTGPSGLSTVVFYNGSPTPPTNAGTYAVLGAIVSQDYAGTDSTTLVINKIDQTITFDGPLSDKNFGDMDFPVSTSASSGLAVNFNASGPCTVLGNVVHLTSKGTCVLTASQIGDVNYNPAPAVPTQSFTISDITPPVITVTPFAGNETVNLAVGQTYNESGATAIDDVDGPVTVTVGGDIVSTIAPAIFHVTYDAVDSSGNHADQATRTVNVSLAPDTEKPVITILGDNPVTVSAGLAYHDAGATAIDNVDGNITNQIIASSTVDTNATGTYSVIYNVSDSADNAAILEIRTVKVVDDIAPTVTLLGDNPAIITLGAVYIEAGATTTDNFDVNVPITISGSVNVNTLGAYTLTYSATDVSGNVATSTSRTVTVNPAPSGGHSSGFIPGYGPKDKVGTTTPKVLGASTTKTAELAKKYKLLKMQKQLRDLLQQIKNLQNPKPKLKPKIKPKLVVIQEPIASTTEETPTIVIPLTATGSEATSSKPATATSTKPFWKFW